MLVFFSLGWLLVLSCLELVRGDLCLLLICRLRSRRVEVEIARNPLFRVDFEVELLLVHHVALDVAQNRKVAIVPSFEVSPNFV